MLTKEAIQTLQKAEAIEQAAAALESASLRAFATAALPSDFSLHDLEDKMPTRRRARGTMKTAAVADFAAYIKAHAETGAAVFVDAKTMTATAVLNLGTPDDPGHADNQATLEAQKTAALQALLKIANGSAVSQLQAAEFLEDWPDLIQCFNDAGSIAPPKAIAAVRKLTIEAMRKLESSEQSLSASRSAFESVSATSQEPIPTTIYFKCTPYKDLAERQFVLRLGVLTGGDKPAIVLRIVKQELHEEEMANELAELVRTRMGEGTPVLLGTYKKSN